MEANKSIYNQQKGISDYKDLKKYSTIVTIKTVINKSEYVHFCDIEGQWYSYKLDLRNGLWQDYLKVGNNVRVFVIERKVKDKIYFNVFPDHFTKEVLVSEDDM